MGSLPDEKVLNVSQEHKTNLFLIKHHLHTVSEMRHFQWDILFRKVLKV